MSKNIYLVDYLGIHCGMHYYLEAMQKVLKESGTLNVEILSNYSPENIENGFFKNQYKGSKFKKGISLFSNLRKLRKFISQHPEDVFVFLTYGNHIDLLFLHEIVKAKNHVIDIHEVIAQNLDTNNKLKEKFKNLYLKKISSVISHSTRTDNFLKEFGYKKTRLSVPHFKYLFSKDFDEKNISSDILNAPEKDKVNLLFFGNLNESKGVDILMDAFNKLDDETASKANLIIAGKDFDGSVNRIQLKEDRSSHIFKRHISDDELRYLYQKADYLCLPYRKTSQSGILEMAFYFQKPIIASDVEYFRITLTEFPSFGVIAGKDEETYSKTLKSIINSHGNTKYFHEKDYAKYENRKEIEDFKKSFNDWVMKSCKS